MKSKPPSRWVMWVFLTRERDPGRGANSSPTAGGSSRQSRSSQRTTPPRDRSGATTVLTTVIGAPATVITRPPGICPDNRPQPSSGTSTGTARPLASTHRCRVGAGRGPGLDGRPAGSPTGAVNPPPRTDQTRAPPRPGPATTAGAAAADGDNAQQQRLQDQAGEQVAVTHDHPHPARNPSGVQRPCPGRSPLEDLPMSTADGGEADHAALRGRDVRPICARSASMDR